MGAVVAAIAASRSVELVCDKSLGVAGRLSISEEMFSGSEIVGKDCGVKGALLAAGALA